MFIKHHVSQRNGNYYYRLAVPSDLKHLIPFREINHPRKPTIQNMQSVLPFQLRAKFKSVLIFLLVDCFMADLQAAFQLKPVGSLLWA
jgi:hypothetical protein